VRRVGLHGLDVLDRVGLILRIATPLAALGEMVGWRCFYTAMAIWPEHITFLDEDVVYASSWPASLRGSRRSISV